MTQFHYLKHGLGIVLAFVGIKMLIADYFKVPVLWSLGIIVAVILGAVIKPNNYKTAVKDRNKFENLRYLDVSQVFVPKTCDTAQPAC